MIPILHLHYSKEEFARRGDEIYEHDIRPLVEAGNEGKYVALDIETGAYEIDSDELAASDRLLARRPEAQIWLRQIGSRYARRFGPRHRPVMRYADVILCVS
jgi:hypothetical protein